MRRPSALVCLAALSACGLAAAAPAAAAPAAPAPASPPPPRAVPDQLVVGYVAGSAPAARERARGRASAVRQEQVVAPRAGRGEVELVRLPRGRDRAAAIRALEADPAVAYAEPNWVYEHQATSTDPYFTRGRLWGMYGDASSPANQFGSQAAEAWASGSTGAGGGVYVGVIDQGIEHTHPDLSGQVGNPGERRNGLDDDGNGYVDDLQGWDFVGDDSSVYDGGNRGNLDDHGTHVAGTLGAKSDGRGVVGVSWGVRMISGKFLGRNGGSLADAVQAVDYFTDLKTRRGLDVVATNNSWGGGGYSQALFDAISRADAADILFVAAAGNSGSDNDVTPSYPSGYELPNVIAVAAIDEAGALASFSQYGATTVDLGAPGVGVWSTTASKSYSSYSGTSMATPHVTGAAALYAASHPTATAAEIKAALLDSAAPTASLAGRTVTGGRLDASGFSTATPSAAAAGTAASMPATGPGR